MRKKSRKPKGQLYRLDNGVDAFYYKIPGRGWWLWITDVFEKVGAANPGWWPLIKYNVNETCLRKATPLEFLLFTGKPVDESEMKNTVE